jgi:hypothetical protein
MPQRGRKRGRYKKRKPTLLSASAKIGVAGLIGKAALDSGVPRLLGVRLERHSTSRKTAKSILRSGGVVDPNYGGSGAIGHATGTGYTEAFKRDLKKYAYVSGAHPKGGHTKLNRILNNPAGHALYRKGQAAYYRNLAGNPPGMRQSKIKTAGKAVAAGLGLQGRTLFVPGSDQSFAKGFEVDPDDALAMRTRKKFKVYGSRASATLGQLKEKGLISSLKDNKGRVAGGAIIIGLGGAATYKLGQSAANDLKGARQRRKRRYFGRRRKVRLSRSNSSKAFLLSDLSEYG